MSAFQKFGAMSLPCFRCSQIDMFVYVCECMCGTMCSVCVCVCECAN